MKKFFANQLQYVYHTKKIEFSLQMDISLLRSQVSGDIDWYMNKPLPPPSRTSTRHVFVMENNINKNTRFKLQARRQMLWVVANTGTKITQLL